MIRTLLLLVGCSATTEPPAAPSPVEVPASKPEQPGPETSEAERHVRALSNRAHERIRAPARRWLVEHPDEAWPVLVEVLGEKGPEAREVLRVLGELDRTASIPHLEAVLQSGSELLADPAARALARHADPSATAALVKALDAAPPARHAALDALGARGDASACEAVRALLPHEEASTRYRAARAAHALQCLTAEDRGALAEDPSEDVRELLSSLD